MLISTEENGPSTFQKIKNTVYIGLLLIAAIIFISFMFGTHDLHEDTNHYLYDCFNQSPQHAALIRQLQQSKLSILHGRKQDGLFHFAEHYANELSIIDIHVFVEDITKTHFKLYQIANTVKKSLNKWFGVEKVEGDWFIYSRDGTIVEQKLIDKIMSGNPNSKIIIVTTSLLQRNPGFKEFDFPKIDEHQMEESIERNYQVSENTADILYDYFWTPENAFDSMTFETFSHQEFLGDNYRSLEGLSIEDNRILKDLCKKGEGDSEQESLTLTELGVVFYKGQNYWLNAEARLNYELHKDLNCKNKLIPEYMLRQVEEIKEREAQQRREREKKQVEETKKEQSGDKSQKKNRKKGRK